jgi:hypothetical protein
MSVSGLSSGNFDQAGITYDLSVGLDQDSGTAGQVLISGGTGRPMSWGSNSANLPNALVKGTNITMTTAGGDVTEFDGLVRTTISATDTNTEYTGTAPIDISVSDVISLNKDATLTTISDNLSVVKVPNTLTITDSAGTSVVFDGSATTSITINDDDTTYQAGTGISIDTSTDPDTINCSNIPNTALTNSTISGKELGTNLSNLTAGTNISFDVGTTYNGSQEITISANDTDTTYQAGTGISIDTSTDPDTINCSNIPNIALANSTISGISLGSNLANLTAGTNISFDVGTTYNGSTAITISATDTDTGITTLNEGDGINITSVSATEKTISANIDGITLEFKTDTLGAPEPKEIAVKKVPNDLTFTGFRTGTYNGGGVLTIDLDDIPNSALTNSTISGKELGTNLSNLVAGTNITFSVGTTYDGSQEITISATDTDTGITTLNGGDGITITDVSATEKTILVDKVDGSGLVFTSGELDLDSIPNSNLANSTISGVALGGNLANLTAGSGISMSGGTTYNGQTAVTISATTDATTRTITKTIYPVNRSEYAVYRRQISDSRSTSMLMYPIDTNFNYTFDHVPLSRYYKVDIQFAILNATTEVSGLEPVLIRLDKDNSNTNGWDFPSKVITAHPNGNQTFNLNITIILDLGTETYTLLALPKVHPVMIQQTLNAVSPTEGNRTTNKNAVIYYGGGNTSLNGARGLTMVLTPLSESDVDINTPSSGSPYTIPPSGEDY